jgi:hypothetical protein
MHVFSGRPDPEWTLPADQARRLRSLAESLPKTDAALPAPPALGYRGIELRTGEESWTAFHELVQRATRSAVEARFDRTREFERALLASAPPGALAPPVLELARG